MDEINRRNENPVKEEFGIQELGLSASESVLAKLK
jgi:hypothetical protein